jgi:putative DNA primase/helicase
MDKSTASGASTQDIPPRPHALPVTPENIPEPLKALKQWVIWRYFWVPDEQKYDKPPMNAHTGNLASTTNAATWSTFDQAMAAYATGHVDGIGLVVCRTNGIVAGDLDHCRDPKTGEITPEALAIIRALNTYTEISPSAEGFRWFAKGPLPGKGRKRGTVEVYNHARYVTVTGQHLEGTPTTIEPRQEAIDALLTRVFGTQQAGPEPQNPHPDGDASLVDDDDILARACAARNGEKFMRLWNGDTADYARDGNDGHSEADLALCVLISRWTRSPAQIDRLFRRSKLMRAKWDAPRGDATYGARTIARALTAPPDDWEAWEPDEPPDDWYEALPDEGPAPGPANGDAGEAEPPTPPPPTAQATADQGAQQQQQQSRRSSMLFIRHGKRVISCQHNALAWLTKHGYEPRIWLDTFRQSVFIDDEPLSDELIIELVRRMEASARIRWADAHVRSAVISMGTRRAVSSLTRWLDALVWDQRKRLRTFFADAYGAEVTEYSAACAEVMFRSGVARAYQPGCQADVTVVLIGDQGIGKSRGIAELVLDPSWYTDDLGGDLYDRKAAEGLQGKWIVEFGEFARINRATVDVVKAFLSRRVDHYRPAYGHVAKDFPRQCIFIGTTNNPLPLHDLENRRFMPVFCPKPLSDITSQREQLWAEAVHGYKAGEPWWVTDQTLLATVKERQEEARQHDEWEEILRDALRAITQITLVDAARRLGITTDRLDKSTQIRLGLAMKAIGYRRKRQTTGSRAYYWERTVPP